jgi:hypothetical protein
VWGLASAPPGQQLARAQPAQPPLVQLARSDTAPSALPDTRIIASAAAPGVQHMVINASDEPMLRDPQLDNLLAAHRRMAGFNGGTSAFLRSATFEEQQR